MFQIAPTVWSHFAFGKGVEEGEDLTHNEHFIVFAKQFVGMLDMAIDMLGPDLEMVEEQLQQLGIRHIRYGVMPKHYPLMGKALLQTIENKLGDQFTDRHHDSWNAIYTFMSVSMMQGAFQQLVKDRDDFIMLKKSVERNKQTKKESIQSGDGQSQDQNRTSIQGAGTASTASRESSPQEAQSVWKDDFSERTMSSTEFSDDISALTLTSARGKPRAQIGTLSSGFLKRFARGGQT